MAGASAAVTERSGVGHGVVVFLMIIAAARAYLPARGAMRLDGGVGPSLTA
jgi:hypothetical protein